MVADIRQQSEAVVSFIQQQAHELDQAAVQVAGAGEQLTGIAELASGVEAQVAQITAGTASNHERLTALFVALDQLRSDALDSGEQTRQLEQAAEKLVGQAESASEQLAEVQLDDYHQHMFDLARRGATAIAARFEADIDAGRIRLDDLFDRKYQAQAGTDPQKYHTRFDRYADEVLPPIQEPLLAGSEAVVYAIATTPEATCRRTTARSTTRRSAIQISIAPGAVASACSTIAPELAVAATSGRCCCRLTAATPAS